MITMRAGANVEDKVLHKKSLRCSCGSLASLHFKTKIGRYKDTIVTVLNVPVYDCFDCSESFMQGTDSLHFATQVRKASVLKDKTILFNEERTYN